MVTNWSGGTGNLLWSCGMKYALRVQVEPGQEVDLGAVTVVAVEDLGHDDTLQGLLDLFWKDLKLHFHLQGYFNPLWRTWML